MSCMLSGLKTSHATRTVLTSESPSRAPARRTEPSSASATPSICLAARRASRRAMRRTDFCHFTSSYQHPRLVGSRCVERLRASQPRRSPDSTSVRLASVGCTFPFETRRTRRCPPDVTHANRTSDTPVASPAKLTPLARCLPLESRRGYRRSARVNDANPQAPRDVFDRARTSAPQRPFGRPARASPSYAVWPPRAGLSTPFHHRVPLSVLPVARPSFTRPAANGSRASLDLGVARRLLQPLTTHGHTQRAADLRTRVGLSPRCSPAPTDASCVGRLDALPHRGPANRELLVPALRATRSACAD